MKSKKCDTSQQIKDIFQDISNEIFTGVKEIMDTLCNKTDK